MFENSYKALALSACFLSPEFLQFYSQELTELQELRKETSLAAVAVVQLSVTILKI